MRFQNNKRIRDNKLEHMLTYSLDAMYSKLGYSYSRIRDNDLQTKGVDVIFYPPNSDGNKLYIDEKAAVTCMTRDLHTFSFEWSSENNPSRLGWLRAPGLKTTHYAIIYPRSEVNNIRRLDSLEWLLISKKKITNIVYSIPNLDEVVSSLYSEKYYNPKTNRNQRYVNLDNNGEIMTLKFVWSRNIYPEKPVNVLFNKEDLIKMADKHILIQYNVHK